MEVWVIETGGYEPYVFGVASSVEAAVEYIKDQHPEPYVVEWSEVIPPIADEGCGLTGKFKAVSHYSTEHEAYFAIQKYEVHGT